MFRFRTQQKSHNKKEDRLFLVPLNHYLTGVATEISTTQQDVQEKVQEKDEGE